MPVLPQLNFAPELFAMRVSMAMDWVKKNLRSILYGGLGAIVIALLIVAWTSWQGHRREQAAVLLHQALKLKDQDSETNQAANSDQVIEQLQTITQKYGRTPAGARAYWHLGHLYFARGEMSEALEAYQVARRRTPNRQPLSSTLAILNMGYAQEATDACDEAITSYESVQQSPIHWLHGEAYLGMGRCHEKAGATDKAIEVYDRALADVRVTGAAQQTISERLARLQPDEPEAPAAETPDSSDDKPKTENTSEPTEPAAPSTDEQSEVQPSEAEQEAAKTQ